jgi:urea transport system permease protein
VTAVLIGLTLVAPASRAEGEGEAVAVDASLSEALSDLGSEDAKRMSDAITKLSLSQSKRALIVLRALEAGNLKFSPDGHAFIESEGQLSDALTSDEATAPEGLHAPSVSNQVRRALGPALAKLQLKTGDTDERLAAAATLMETATDELLPAMREAYEKEQDEDVKEKLGVALAKPDLDSEDPKVRLEAVKTIDAAGAVELRGKLERLLKKGDDGEFYEKDSEVRAAATTALSTLRAKVFLFSQIANLFYGVSLGSVLLLAALGLAITFGLMRVINMAHGEMLMLGAYSTYVVQNLFAEYAPSLQGAYLICSIPVAFVFTALVGMAMERGIIRFLYGRPLETLLATWGISLCLIQTVRMVFGASNVTVANPEFLSGGFELVPDVVLPYSRIAITLFVCFVVAFVWFMLQRTKLGLFVRAVTQNRGMAANMGIATHRIDMWTFGLGSGVAGLGGVALSQIGNVGPELGQGYIVDSFMVVVLGGVGKLAGTVVGALGLGVVNKFLEPISGAVLGKIFVLVFIILFIQKRPQGIFALKGRAAEL